MSHLQQGRKVVDDERQEFQHVPVEVGQEIFGECWHANHSFQVGDAVSVYNQDCPTRDRSSPFFYLSQIPLEHLAGFEWKLQVFVR